MKNKILFYILMLFFALFGCKKNEPTELRNEITPIQEASSINLDDPQTFFLFVDKSQVTEEQLTDWDMKSPTDLEPTKTLTVLVELPDGTKINDHMKSNIILEHYIQIKVPYNKEDIKGVKDEGLSLLDVTALITKARRNKEETTKGEAKVAEVEGTEAELRQGIEDANARIKVLKNDDNKFGFDNELVIPPSPGLTEKFTNYLEKRFLGTTSKNEDAVLKIGNGKVKAALIPLKSDLAALNATLLKTEEDARVALELEYKERSATALAKKTNDDAEALTKQKAGTITAEEYENALKAHIAEYEKVGKEYRNFKKSNTKLEELRTSETTFYSNAQQLSERMKTLEIKYKDIKDPEFQIFFKELKDYSTFSAKLLSPEELTLAIRVGDTARITAHMKNIAEMSLCQIKYVKWVEKFPKAIRGQPIPPPNIFQQFEKELMTEHAAAFNGLGGVLLESTQRNMRYEMLLDEWSSLVINANKAPEAGLKASKEFFNTKSITKIQNERERAYSALNATVSAESKEIEPIRRKIEKATNPKIKEGFTKQLNDILARQSELENFRVFP